MLCGLSALVVSNALISIDALLFEAHELLVRGHNLFLIFFTGANSIGPIKFNQLGPYYSKSLY